MLFKCPSELVYPPQALTSNAPALSHLTKQILAVNDKLQHPSHPALLES